MNALARHILDTLVLDPEVVLQKEAENGQEDVFNERRIAV